MTGTLAEESHRLARCIEALQDAVSEKSLYHEDWGRVAERIDGLRHLAQHPTRLPSPWPELCTYRLAHILMRNASSEGQLRRIINLLDEVGDLPGLGARPLLLRVAALHRLLALRSSPADRLDLEQSFQRAAQVWNDTYARDDDQATSVSQGVAQNLIEQTAYLTGLPFPPNMLPDPNAHFFHGGGWLVVMKGLPVAELPKGLAQTFFNNLVQDHEPQIRFTLDWRADVTAGGKTFTETTGRFLAMICIDAVCRGTLGTFFDGKQEQADQRGTIDVYLNRTRRALASSLKGLNAEPGTVITGSVAEATLSLAENLRFVGLVEKSRLPRIL